MRAFAYRLLGRREYSVYELGQRLRQKWRSVEDIDALADELVEALLEENLVSDERFAESFVRSRIQRCQGPLKIKAELRNKINELRDQLNSVLEKQFERELQDSLQRIREAIAPYTRFVRVEREKLEKLKAELDRAAADLDQMRSEVKRLDRSG